MSCNRCATTAERIAPAAGAGAIEATWSANRAHPQQCGECGGFLRGDGGCTQCERGIAVTSDGHTSASSSATLAMAAPGASGIVNRAAGDGETVIIGDHWRNEFASVKRGGRVIDLSNGDSIEAGKRYSGKEYPEYCVALGKKRQQVTTGNYITPAVDQIEGWRKAADNIVEVTTSDGGKGYYDLEKRAACCDGNCADSQGGMCHHQMAAIVAGEMAYRETDNEFEERLQQQLREEFKPETGGLRLFSGSRTVPPTTQTVLRRSDAAYAYLKNAVSEVKINAGSVKAAVSTPPKAAAAPKKRRIRKKGASKSKGAAKPAALPSHGNPQVNAVMTAIGVTPPVATVAQMQDADPTLEGYSGFPVPASDPRYEVGQQEEKRIRQIMQRTNMSWQAAKRRVAASGGDVTDPAAYPATMEDRCWGLYGPPGTGKNAMAKEVAASLGLGYMEIDVRDRSDFQTLLCDTVIEADGKGGTRSVVKLGPVGHALTNGNVVALNEIVAADPDAQTALHQVLQDGVIRAPGPEGATQSWQVHPNSMVFLTWNPGTTRADKPGAALLSRTPSLEMDYPPPQDEARRLASTMSDYLGEGVAPGDVKRCVNLVRGLRELHLRGELESCPTYRDMVSFTKSYYLNGQNRHEAAEVFEVLCSQMPGQKEDEWKQVHNLVDSFQEGTWKL